MRLVSRDRQGRELWRCSCGSEFRGEDDAETHAANAREDEADRGD